MADTDVIADGIIHHANLLSCRGATPVSGRPGEAVVEAAVALVALGTVAHAAGTEIVSTSVETVPPKAKALPSQVTVLPIVIPDASISVPAKVEFAPSVVAAVGVHHRSHEDAPPANVTMELAEVVRAPSILKMYVPAPVSVIVPPPPMLAAPSIQYTPGVN